MSVLIFANGDMPEIDWVRPYLDRASAVVAADGGVYHVLRTGRFPDVVVGDMDSIGQDVLAELQQMQIKLDDHPREKDETDLELALLYAAKQYAEREILVFGVLGGRLDQTLANILLLAHPELRHKRVRLVEKHQRAWIVHDQTNIRGRVGDTVSLIPLGGNVHIAHTEHLKWPLIDETLSFGPARGVSNVLTAENGRVVLKHGQLLCIHSERDWER